MTLDYPVPFHTPNLVWDSTIAIYLFLLGISSGAVQLAIAYKRSHKLENPSKNWIIFKEDIMALIQRFMPKLGFVGKIINVLERLTGPVEVILFILAAVLGAYTGFLLSALISYPMLNNPVLPALFLASGTSSGIAATFLFILIAGKLKGDSHESHFIHKFEVPIMVTELGLLICFFVGLHFGGGQKVVALHNALSGFWGAVFWIGVFLIGIIIPLLANLAAKDSLKYNKNFIILVSIFDLIGVLCLRYFILYAGQLTVA